MVLVLVLVAAVMMMSVDVGTGGAKCSLVPFRGDIKGINKGIN